MAGGAAPRSSTERRTSRKPLTERHALDREQIVGRQLRRRGKSWWAPEDVGRSPRRDASGHHGGRRGSSGAKPGETPGGRDIGPVGARRANRRERSGCIAPVARGRMVSPAKTRATSSGAPRWISRHLKGLLHADRHEVFRASEMDELVRCGLPRARDEAARPAPMQPITADLSGRPAGHRKHRVRLRPRAPRGEGETSVLARGIAGRVKWSAPGPRSRKAAWASARLAPPSGVSRASSVTR